MQNIYNLVYFFLFYFHSPEKGQASYMYKRNSLGNKRNSLGSFKTLTLKPFSFLINNLPNLIACIHFPLEKREREREREVNKSKIKKQKQKQKTTKTFTGQAERERE